MIAIEDASTEPRFQRYPDLAARRLGTRALAASDEFFAPKENLLLETRPAFEADRYTERGKWMDGWETRRRRGPGHDWVVIRLGAPGVVHGVNVDTSHFRGNHPERASVEACEVAAGNAEAGGTEIAGFDGWPWTTIVPELPLAPGAGNFFPARERRRWTHVRLNIFPDGGVARFRVHGIGVPVVEDAEIDLAAIASGGVVLAWSDARFGAPHSLLLPDRPPHMGDGWETRRRRGPGHDWVVVRLGRRGVLRCAAIDTTHFKGNHPESFRLEALDDEGAFGDAIRGLELPPGDHAAWREVLPRTPLGADARHEFEVRETVSATHVRLSIYPDGGVARLRIYGEPAPPREVEEVGSD
jgi:allantoicase